MEPAFRPDITKRTEVSEESTNRPELLGHIKIV